LADTILTFQLIKANFVNEVFTKLSKDIRILFYEPAIKAKILTFMLPTEKRLVVSLWTFFKFRYRGNQGELERTETTKNFCWCRGIFV